MIFVTVGSSLPFNGLIQHIDELKKSKEINDVVYAQIGNGLYVPETLNWKRFIADMNSMYSKADIIIGTCGAGTIMENVIYGRKYIAVANPDIIGGHEWELVSKLSDMGCLLFCKDFTDILHYIELSKKMKFNVFVPDKFDIRSIVRLLK